MVGHIGVTVIGIAVTGKTNSNAKARRSLRAFLLEYNSLASRPSGFCSAASARVIQSGVDVFFTLTSELFLCGFEIRHACCDFLALARQPIVPFAHAHPLAVDSRPINMGVQN